MFEQFISALLLFGLFHVDCFSYRNFPVVSDKMVDLVSPRKYLCNFAGTIYRNSSREILLEVLWSNHLLERCFVKERLEYVHFELNVRKT